MPTLPALRRPPRQPDPYDEERAAIIAEGQAVRTDLRRKQLLRRFAPLPTDNDAAQEARFGGRAEFPDPDPDPFRRVYPTPPFTPFGQYRHVNPPAPGAFGDDIEVKEQSRTQEWLADEGRQMEQLGRQRLR